MTDWKIVIGVIVGSFAVIALAAFGLSRISQQDGGVSLAVDKQELVEGSGWIKEEGEVRVEVVEFADLQCPSCKREESVARQLRKMEGVRYVWRFFPLISIHKNALNSAYAAEASRRMDKGWEMVELLFVKQSEWSERGDFDELVLEYAQSLGLEGEAFASVYGSDEVRDYVAGDLQLAEKLRLNGTPTFFVDGKLVGANLVMTEVNKLLNK